MFYYFIDNGSTILKYEKEEDVKKYLKFVGRQILIEANSESDAWEIYCDQAYDFLIKNVFTRDILFVRGYVKDNGRINYTIITFYKKKFCTYSIVIKDKNSDKMNSLLLEKYGSKNIIKDYDEYINEYKYYNKQTLPYFNFLDPRGYFRINSNSYNDYYTNNFILRPDTSEFVTKRQFNSSMYNSFDASIPIRDTILFDIEPLKHLFLKSQIRKRKEIIEKYNNIISSYDKLEELLRKLSDEERLLLELGDE